MSFKIPAPIRCLLSKDPVTGLTIGHCLDFGLVTSGKTEERAWKNLKEVVRLHIEHCWTHTKDPFKHRASLDKWAIFEQLSARETNSLKDKIALNLAPTEQELPIWIEGLELDACSDNVQRVS